MDELRLQIAANKHVKDSCILLFTETWLHQGIPDSAIELAGRTVQRHDRTADSGKRKGGGLCMYVNISWCTNTVITDRHCSPDIEYLTIKCRPIYLPREFTVVTITAVYIPPDANANSAIALLHANVSNQQSRYPGAVHIIAGDFNHADLRTALPKLHQHVKCATRGDNTLDKVYSNIKGGYRASPLPHLGQSDHISLFLIPAYAAVKKSAHTTTRTVTIWPEEASMQLQDCFERTNWDIFEHQNLDVFTDSVLCYIKNCIDTVTVQKRIRVYPNQKPWMTRGVQQLLKQRNIAFRTGDRDHYSAARADLRRGIKLAKAEYRRRIEVHLESNNSRQVWQGIQHLTNYKTNPGAAEGDPALAEELNIFFARFEVTAPEAQQHHAAHSSTVLTLEEHGVRRSLRAVNPRKATGPDGVPGRVLRDCADQLAGIFTRIFNRSLAQSNVPPCLKSSIIVPVPKKPHISGLNDYRPVALTPVVMKCFEKLVRNHITSALPRSLDPHQFAYRANRSTEDAVATALHAALSHLEGQGNYVRMLFVDYSSAFNTILPHRLVTKLRDLGLPHTTCMWINSFLSDRKQRVRIGHHTSPALSLSTGSPQGCVLSPLLYSLYTHDCSPVHQSNTIIKFADDTTVVGPISGGDESAYRDEVTQLVSWCVANNLLLNTSKTKELIIDYRKKRTEISPLNISGQSVERVTNFRFLGVSIEDNLTWSANTSELLKKSQHRLYFLRTLRKSNITQRLLICFYRATIESIMTYCICIWYASSTAAQRNALQGVIKTAQKIVGCPLPTLEDLHRLRCVKKAHNIIKDTSHPGHPLFELLPSGKRYRSIRARTNRFMHSFYPTAITCLNAAKTKAR
ncbi:hypothetical protein PAMA_022061 [Pampus argenteus]